MSESQGHVNILEKTQDHFKASRGLLVITEQREVESDVKEQKTGLGGSSFLWEEGYYHQAEGKQVSSIQHVEAEENELVSVGQYFTNKHDLDDDRGD